MTTIHLPKELLSEMIKDIRFAMLTTTNEAGDLHSRPMTTQQEEPYEERHEPHDGTLWFIIGRSSQSAADIQAHPRVNLSYSDPATHRYVSVSGHASLVEDRQRLVKFWQSDYSVWFPKGVDDPELVLLKVSAESAEIWQSPSTWIGRTLAFAKSLVTGEPTAREAFKTSDPSHPNPTRLGRVNWTVLLWAIGVPLPLLLIVALMRGCS